MKPARPYLNQRWFVGQNVDLCKHGNIKYALNSKKKNVIRFGAMWRFLMF